ncbi:MAG: DUF692 domain-containing protein [Polyangiaceae bacterium]
MHFRDRHRIADLGVGVGARPPHYGALLEHAGATLAHGEVDPSRAATTASRIGWLEVISENFMGDGGRPRASLDALSAKYPIVTHGVSLSIGGTDPLDPAYLSRLRRLCDRLNPPWFSDHLCFTRAGGVDLHDLLPLPMTRETIVHVSERIRRVVDVIGRPFALENVSSYLTYSQDEMPEWAFLSEIAERADCGILFDVNNVFVSAKNHGFDPHTYLDSVPHDRILQFHLAGHTDRGTHLLDTHGTPVSDPVWSLYRDTLRKVGKVSTLIEWDEDIPPFETLQREVEKATLIRSEVFR